MKIILAKFNFGDFVMVRQFVKFSSSPKFVVIRYNMFFLEVGILGG